MNGIAQTDIIMRFGVYVVLPPVLVPRNPQMITSVYEPVPSYLDSGRSSYSPNNDVNTLNFDTPGKPWC